MISSSSLFADIPADASARVTHCTRSGFLNWIGERLTANVRCGGHLAASLQACHNTQSPSGRMTLVSSGQRDEFIRGDQAALRMVPQHERLEAGQLDGIQVDDRLIADPELLPQQRRTQIGARGFCETVSWASISCSKYR